MTLLFSLVAGAAFLGVLLLAGAIRRFRHGRPLVGAVECVCAAALFALAGCVALISENLAGYQRLTHEDSAARVAFVQTAPHQFEADLTYPTGSRKQFMLRGDQWQIDARVLKWRPLANLLGFDTAYRLERIAGRYNDIESERSAARTVYELASEDGLDLWVLAQRFKAWLPWVDAYYGSAAYVPMADGASYEVSVSQSGLVARPLNQAARGAVSAWH
jgi:hypothetical protein